MRLQPRRWISCSSVPSSSRSTASASTARADDPIVPSAPALPSFFAAKELCNDPTQTNDRSLPRLSISPTAATTTRRILGRRSVDPASRLSIVLPTTSPYLPPFRAGDDQDIAHTTSTSGFRPSTIAQHPTAIQQSASQLPDRRVHTHIHQSSHRQSPSFPPTGYGKMVGRVHVFGGRRDGGIERAI